MTNQEAIKEFKDRYEIGKRDYAKLIPEYVEAHDMAIKALEQQESERWIPVSERLPEDLEESLIECFLVTNGFNIWMAYYNSKTGWIFAECTNAMQIINWTDIKAWRPLPKPYSE